MRVSSGHWIRRVGLWTLALTCVVYAGFGPAMAGIEIASCVDPGIDSKLRTLPTAFVAFALSGAAPLLMGPLQFHHGLRRRSPWVHEVTGRAYVTHSSV